MKKRGLSPVIATVALIFLTFVAILIIAGVVVPFVRENLSESDCFNYQEYYSFERDFGYNCLNSTESGNLSVISVRAGSKEEDLEVAGFKLVFLRNDGSESVEISNSNSVVGNLRMLNSSETQLVLPKGGEVRTYVYTSSKAFEEVRIFTKLESGRFCDSVESISLAGRVCTDPTDIAP